MIKNTMFMKRNMFLGFKKSSKHPSQLKTSVKQIPPHEKHVF